MDKHVNLETTILASSWWAAAEETADRHKSSETWRTVADHLLAVHRLVELLLHSAEVVDPYALELRRRLHRMGVPATVAADLEIVALLHDVGKPRESKQETTLHPLTGKRVARRHPVVGAGAALELIPETHGRRLLIAALVAKHGTGWSWYRQWASSGQLPSRKAWRRLDRRLPAGREGLGVVLLVLFKLADVDGHAELSDVPWFARRANQALLDDLGMSIPVPDLEALERLRASAHHRGRDAAGRALDLSTRGQRASSP